MYNEAELLQMALAATRIKETVEVAERMIAFAQTLGDRHGVVGHAINHRWQEIAAEIETVADIVDRGDGRLAYLPKVSEIMR